MANPADMSDDELKKVIETGVEPDEPEAPKPAEKEPAAEPETPEEPETPAEAPEVPAEEPKGEEQAPQQPSRREQLRVTDLLKKYGPPPAQQERPAPSTPQEALDYQKAFEITDPEVVKQLEADRKRTGDAQYNAGLAQAEALVKTSEWKTMLSIDAPRTEDKYGWLNPNNKEEFNPAVADAVNEEFKQLSGFDPQTGLVTRPDIRYSDFIDARVELSTRLAKAMTADTAKNIAKQTSQTGLRPDGSSAPRLNLNKAPQEMSLEELYASIGQTQPKK